MLYFAYGSNMLSARLRTRAPSATALGTATLALHELRFHKHARDGSAKCDAVPTGRTADAVHGVLYRIAVEDWIPLDRAEGRGAGYERHVVTLDRGPSVRIEAYLAQPGYIALGLLPYGWYRDLVVAGAREHGLPADYVERLARQESVPDPDVEREARERSFLRR